MQLIRGFCAYGLVILAFLGAYSCGWWAVGLLWIMFVMHDALRDWTLYTLSKQYKKLEMGKEDI
jgi:hypothetical protein